MEFAYRVFHACQPRLQDGDSPFLGLVELLPPVYGLVEFVEILAFPEKMCQADLREFGIKLKQSQLF